MKTTSIKFFLFCVLFTAISGCEHTNKPIWMTADPNLPEIAAIRKHSHDSYIVIYNPDYCERLGEACNFFIGHANAHYMLNHTLFLRPKFYTVLAENQADCYAAKYAKPNAVKAAVELMLDENRDPDLKINGDPILRAKNITECAKSAGNWNGD